MTPKLLLVLVVLGAAGCRSDGGIDRRDCEQGMSFSLRMLSQQTQHDITATNRRVASLPGSLARATTESLENLRDTHDLYLETHETH